MKGIYKFLIFFLLYSCKKEDIVFNDTNGFIPGVDVYACGYDTYYYFVPRNPYPQSKIRAVYWKNNELQSLNQSQEIVSSVANDIAVTQHHIYVAGEYDGRPCYWVDGQKYYLIADIAWDGRAMAAVLINDIFYIAGEARSDSNFPYSAFLWIVKSPNEIQQIQLSDLLSYSNRIFLDQSVVYIAGKKLNTPCYWTWDGSTVNLHPLGGMNNYSGEIYSLNLQNNTVYGCGYFDLNGDGNYYVGYWSDSQFTPSGMISADATFRDMAFDLDGKLCFVGRKKINNTNKAAYWKSPGMEPLILSDKESGIMSILFDNSDYYLSGSVDYRAAYWKNGGEPIFFNSNTNSAAQKIYVVHK